ncbi:hypothetical protein SELR_04840 [Selenomonas ruminantium subsp. lactilytica TAM6421]|uniref:Uncharacterized protein n=1 Tax=Selenomonas ruminantium subsp. lactilytica (strain NBRC 103574 / TAM6421) TaxID=927704 RepID=I0GN55_SELRL|nr:hypothetical protein [Selenomonas ruminantium]BAL82192.1 hypothetical protein SELR_04840 [Selenomonas ruminantium subsp. lactilytica TAM6421]
MEITDRSGLRASIFRQLSAYYAGDLAAGAEAARLIGELLGLVVTLPAGGKVSVLKTTRWNDKNHKQKPMK